MKRLLAIIVLLAAAGCARVPFEEPARVNMEGADPAVLVARFREEQPVRFRTMSSVVFEFGGRSVAALGVTEVDLAGGTFTAVALNPMGVKLFELAGAADGTISGFLIDAVAQGRAGAAQAIGEDIRRVYFDLLPAAGAASERRRDGVIFRAAHGSGSLVHVFAGEGGRLRPALGRALGQGHGQGLRCGA